MTSTSGRDYTPALVVVEKTDEERSRGPHQRSISPVVRAPKRADLGKIGRRAAAVLYGALALWIGGAALVSVVPQIFWPNAAHQVTAADCPDALSSLRADLLTAAASFVGESSDRAALDAAFDGFDDRYTALRDACGDASGYADLLAFRYALESDLDRHASDVRPLGERVRTTLGH